MGLRDIYFRIEDGYYRLIDKIDRVIPIGGLVERIDKVVPSFIVCIVIILALIFAAIFMLPGLALGGEYTGILQIMDEEGNPLDATIRLTHGGTTEVYPTNPLTGKTAGVTLPAGTLVTVAITENGFDNYTSSAFAWQGSAFSNGEREISLSRILEEGGTWTINIYNSSGQPLSDREVTLRFMCTRSSVEAPGTMQVSTGRVTVDEPDGCGGLRVMASADGFEQGSYTLVTESLYLSEAAEEDPEEGTIIAYLKLNGELISESVNVILCRNDGFGGCLTAETLVAVNGQAIFTRAPGSYFVRTSSTDRYTGQESEIFTLMDGGTAEVILHLEEDFAGEIKLQIVDGDTGEGLGDALVTLKLDNTEIGKKTTEVDEDGKLDFRLQDEGMYSVFVDHEDYCFGVFEDIEIADSYQQLELEKFTGQCGSDFRVVVSDEFGNPLQNATVGLYTDDKYSTGFDEVVTDVEGIAIFTRVPTDDYTGFAFKGSFSGWSEPVHFDQRAAEETVLSITLIIPNGGVAVSVTDTDGNPVQFAEVALIDAGTYEMIGGGTKPVEDATGIVNFSLPASKRVYATVSKDGYTNYTSIVYEVQPEGEISIPTVLEPERISGEIEIEYLGLYRQDKLATVLAPGNEYTAKFKLRIPKNREYSEIGAHVRTGVYSIIEKDKLVIKKINAGGQSAVVKSTAYDPDEGYEIDAEHITNAEAKWANITWRDYLTGIIELEAVLRVKENASLNDDLELNYRAYGVMQGDYTRDPIDTELGNNESVGNKEALYANAYTEIYRIGIETTCDDRWCFSASILDLEEDLARSVTAAYDAEIFNNYELMFSVTNNSEFETESYYGAEIRIMDEDEVLLMGNYEIIGAQNQTTEGTLNGYETGWISAGDLTPNESMSATVKFAPQETLYTKLLIQIRAGQRVRFERVININVSARNKFSVTVEPEFLPSGIENEITVTVKNAETGHEVADALLQVKDRRHDLVSDGTTNLMGVGVITLPAQKPGEDLNLIVMKRNYETLSVGLSVDEQIVEIDPQQLGIALNVKTAPEGQDMFTAKNQTNFPLTVKSVDVTGRFEGLIDTIQMNNWLFAFENKIIEEDEELEVLVRTFLTDAGKRINEITDLKGNVIFEVEAFGQSWAYEIPLKINIGLGGEVDDPNCLVVTKSLWQDVTEGQPVSTQFVIENGCTVGETPVHLRNLKVKAVWESNRVGEFSLQTSKFSSALRSYPRIVQHIMYAEEEIETVLTFTPDAGVIGMGDAVIEFSAVNEAETGAQIISTVLDAEISVVNLLDCIAFTKDLLKMNEEESAVFGIETLGCGGPVEFTLESDLTLSENSLVLQSEDSAEIEVFAENNYPGQWPVMVSAEGAGVKDDRFVKMIRVQIKTDGCLDLSRYEFDIYDDPNDPYDGYDTVEIINRCHDKEVEIVVDERSWSKAMTDGLKWGLIMAAMGMLGQQTSGGGLFGGGGSGGSGGAGSAGASSSAGSGGAGGNGTGGNIEDECTTDADCAPDEYCCDQCGKAKMCMPLPGGSERSASNSEVNESNGGNGNGVEVKSAELTNEQTEMLEEIGGVVPCGGCNTKRPDNAASAINSGMDYEMVRVGMDEEGYEYEEFDSIFPSEAGLTSRFGFRDEDGTLVRDQGGENVWTEESPGDILADLANAEYEGGGTIVEFYVTVDEDAANEVPRVVRFTGEGPNGGVHSFTPEGGGDYTPLDSLLSAIPTAEENPDAEAKYTSKGIEVSGDATDDTSEGSDNESVINYVHVGAEGQVKLREMYCIGEDCPEDVRFAHNVGPDEVGQGDIGGYYQYYEGVEGIYGGVWLYTNNQSANSYVFDPFLGDGEAVEEPQEDNGEN